MDKENSVAKEAFDLLCKKIDKFERLLESSDTQWKEIEELIDVESFVQYYFIQELTENVDGCRSSFYIWSDGENDKIHLGPVWDYDSSMGAYRVIRGGGITTVDFTINIRLLTAFSSVAWFQKLFSYKEFDLFAKQYYTTEISPVFNIISDSIDNYIESDGVKTTFYWSALRNFQKWTKVLGGHTVFLGGRKSEATFSEEVDFLKSWLEKRVEYLDCRYLIEK